MLYLATASTDRVREAMRAGLLGQLVTPAAANRLEPDVAWAADNGCFGTGYPGDAQYLDWLRGLLPHVARCQFAVAPDVVCDAQATLAKAASWLPAIRQTGYPVALAAQNGLENMIVPWPEFDVLFLGGDTQWKLGDAAERLTYEAHCHGKAVHMGRVNSLRRLTRAVEMGCDSADGTFLAYGPDKNLPQLLSWLRIVEVRRNQTAMRFWSAS